MEKYEKFIKMAKKLGAHDARIVRSDSIVTAAWVRWKCRTGCDGYNTSLCCPPNSPTYRETRELLDSYDKTLLVHFIDAMDDTDPTEVVRKLEKEIFLAGYYKAYALGAGPCRLCEQCTLKLCRHPDKARFSMESCGIDVFGTARNNGFFIEVLKDHSCTMNRYALVLIE